jgi:hypothetical protein
VVERLFNKIKQCRSRGLYVARFTATTNGFSLSARLWVTNALAPPMPSFRAR